MRFLFKIKSETGDVTYAGTDANVFISLAGLNDLARKDEMTQSVKSRMKRGFANEVHNQNQDRRRHLRRH